MAKSRFAVFGIGRYGTQIALSLAKRGAEVFTFDSKAERVEKIKDDVLLAVTLDATDKKALEGQNVQDLDAAVVAIAVSISSGFDVSDTALLTNAACECILGAEATDSFSLSREDLIHRVGEIAWNLQVSKR